MRRLVFIDDDQMELDDFREIVGGDYNYCKVHWPREEAKLFSGEAPSIFVSDLYLPSTSGDIPPTGEQRAGAARAAKQVAERFGGLYVDPIWSDKERLRKTMGAIVEAYDLLQRQWCALGQSPNHGIALFRRVRDRYPGVPFVFYSRKITPEDVIDVLQAGAVDAIRKGALEKGDVLDRLARAQEIFHREAVRSIRAHGFSVNVTVIPKV
jgi:DNA-binding NarL/FixJ family response regulator